MTTTDKENWLCNIQETATLVARQTSWGTVKSVLRRYGASSIEELRPSDYPAVFSDLYAVEADTRD